MSEDEPTGRNRLQGKAANHASGQLFPQRRGQGRGASAPARKSSASAGASGRSVQQHLSQVEKLTREIALLTSYTGDTVYRLRYDTMKYDYISPAVTKLLGFAPEEMKKINFRSLIAETKLVTNGMRIVHSFEELEQVRRKGDVGKWQADYLIRTKDGRKVWVSDISHPWFDETGKVIGSVGSLRDVTDRVEAEAQIREELERIANTDALTGIANRREFFNVLEKELKRIHRTEMDITLLLVDIDNFRKINEIYGQDVGDKVLVDITRIVQACLRETDMQARIGGEEFAVLLPDTSVQGGVWVSERIRERVQKHEFVLGLDQAAVQCTVSIGVSSAVPGQDISASTLFKLADTRLYIAKNSGRNQIAVDEVQHTH